MKMKILAASLLAVAALSSTVPAVAFAQDTDMPAIERARQDARQRIEEAIASRRISREEARPLIERERELQILELRAQSDGRVTPEERVSLRRGVAEFREYVEKYITRPEARRPVPVMREDRELTAMFNEAEDMVNELVRNRYLPQRETDTLRRRLLDLQSRRWALTMQRGYMTPANRDGMVGLMRTFNRDLHQVVDKRAGATRGAEERRDGARGSDDRRDGARGSDDRRDGRRYEDDRRDRSRGDDRSRDGRRD